MQNALAALLGEHERDVSLQHNVHQVPHEVLRARRELFAGVAAERVRDRTRKHTSLTASSWCPRGWRTPGTRDSSHPGWAGCAAARDAASCSPPLEAVFSPPQCPRSISRTAPEISPNSHTSSLTAIWPGFVQPQLLEERLKAK